MSETLLNYLNNEFKLSKKITNFEEDFSNGFLFAEMLHKKGLINNLNDFNDTDDILQIRQNYYKLQSPLKKINIHLDEKTMRNLYNKEKNASANFIYKMKIQFDRKNINFEELMNRLNLHETIQKKEEENSKPFKSLYNKTFTQISTLTENNNNTEEDNNNINKNNNKIVLPIISKTKRNFYNRKTLFLIEEEILPKKKKNSNLNILTPRNNQILTEQNNLKYNNENFVNYPALDKNLFDIGLELKAIDLKIKKYGEGENQNFIPTKIILKKINNIVNEEKRKKKEEIESHKFIPEHEKLIKNSILNNQNNNNEKKSKPKLKKNVPLFKQFEYEKKRQETFNLMAKTMYNEKINRKTSNTNKFYETNANFRSIFSKTFYKKNDNDEFNKYTFFNKLNNENLENRYIQLKKKAEIREINNKNIKIMIDLIYDITTECYNYQNENYSDLVDIPEWKNWMQNFIDGKSSLKIPVKKRSQLEYVENAIDDSNEEEKNKILQSEFCTTNFIDYYFYRGDWKNNISKKILGSRLHIYKTLQEDIFTLIASGKQILGGLKPKEMLKMKNSDFELFDNEYENITIPKDNIINNLLFGDLINLNYDNVHCLLNNNINSEEIKENEQNNNEKNINEENKNSNEKEEEHNQSKNDNENNIENKNDNNNEEILSIPNNLDFSYIPLKLCLIGHIFSGRKTIGNLLSEKYPKLKIYSIESIIKSLIEVYEKIIMPIESHPKFKSMKKNQIENFNKEKESLKEEYKLYIPIIEPYYKKEIDKISDEDKIKILISYIQKDFPFKSKEEIKSNIQKKNEKLLFYNTEIEKIHEEQQKKPNAKMKDLQNYLKEIEKIQNEQIEGFILVDFPETFDQFILFEKLTTGFKQEIDKPPNEILINKFKISEILNISYINNKNIYNENKKSSGFFDNYIWLEVNETETIRRVNNRKLDPNTGIIYHLEDNPPPEKDKKLNERLVDVTEPTVDYIKVELKNYDIIFPKILNFINLFKNLKKISIFDKNEILIEIENIFKELLNIFENDENKNVLNNNNNNIDNLNTENIIEEDETEKYLTKLKEINKKINKNFSENLINNYQKFLIYYKDNIKSFLYEIKIQKENIIKQMNNIQEEFLTFLNLPDNNKKKLLKIFKKKYENFVEKFNLIKRNKIVNSEFNNDIAELTDHFWSLISMKKQDAIDEINDIIKIGYIEKQIELFYKNVEKIFILESKKFVNNINILREYYYNFDPFKNDEKNPYFFEYDFNLILKNTDNFDIYNENENFSPKINKLYNNCFKILFYYDNVIKEIEKNEKEKNNVNNLNNSGVSSITVKKRKKKNDKNDQSVYSEINIINYEEELKTSILNEKNYFKIRLTFLKNFSDEFIKNIKEISNKIFKHLDEWIIFSVKKQNDAMNKLMSTLKEEINNGENILHYDIEFDDFYKFYKKLNLNFECEKITNLDKISNENKTININELKKIYLDLKSYEIQNNFVTKEDFLNIVIKKHLFEYKSNGFMNYFKNLPYEFINNFINKIIIKTENNLEIIKIENLFIFLSLMNISLLNENIEKNILLNNEDKLIFHCFLNKNDFLNYEFWFEEENDNNLFNKKYFKDLKEFLFEINKNYDNQINLIEFLNVLMFRNINFKPKKESKKKVIFEDEEKKHKIQKSNLSKIVHKIEEVNSEEEKEENEENNDNNLNLNYEEEEEKYFDILIN